MNLLTYSHQWIERAWEEMGVSFGANHVPVIQYESLDVDDLSFPFKAEAIASWQLVDGKLSSHQAMKVARVPYVAFALVEPEGVLHIQVQWASRCGYGFKIHFSGEGSVLQQQMCWVS